jgi:hypothetical protein
LYIKIGKPFFKVYSMIAVTLYGCLLFPWRMRYPDSQPYDPYVDFAFNKQVGGKQCPVWAFHLGRHTGAAAIGALGTLILFLILTLAGTAVKCKPLYAQEVESGQYTFHSGYTFWDLLLKFLVAFCGTVTATYDSVSLMTPLAVLLYCINTLLCCAFLSKPCTVGMIICMRQIYACIGVWTTLVTFQVSGLPKGDSAEKDGLAFTWLFGALVILVLGKVWYAVSKRRVESSLLAADIYPERTRRQTADI